MPEEGTVASREAAAAISRELVSLHKQFYGRGPVRARTHLVNDTVLCVLEGGFTVVERTLIEVGRAAAVHDMRTSFQAAMRDQFTAVVESALARRVRRASVERAVAQLVRAADGATDYEKFSRLDSRAAALEFYFDAEQCEAVNEARESVEQQRWAEERVRMQVVPIAPHPAMDDSYFISPGAEGPPAPPN